MATAALALILVSAAATPDAAMHRGTNALEAGRNEEALAHFAAAAERTTDPGLIAFNEGVALACVGTVRRRFAFAALSDAEGPRRARPLQSGVRAGSVVARDAGGTAQGGDRRV